MNISPRGGLEGMSASLNDKESPRKYLAPHSTSPVVRNRHRGAVSLEFGDKIKRDELDAEEMYQLFEPQQVELREKMERN